MSASRISEDRQELRSLSESLPFEVIVIAEFKKPSYRPVSIRQSRAYPSSQDNLQAIGRFLVERGVVELLSSEQVLLLFKEIHWCGYSIRRLGRKRHKTEEGIRKSLVEARMLFSQVEAAEEELFIANRRLIVNCLKPFFWVGQVWIADFLQEGSRALSHAIRKFDFTRGTPFYAYAQRAVQNRLRNYFRNHARAGNIGIRPTWEMAAVMDAMEALKAEKLEDPDNAAISRVSGISESRVARLRPYMRSVSGTPAPPLSLDALLGDTDSNLYDILESKDGDASLLAAERSEIWAAIDRLSGKAGCVMRLRFMEGRTLEESGKILNLTRARIKQIEDESLKKVRRMLRCGATEKPG